MTPCAAHPAARFPCSCPQHLRFVQCNRTFPKFHPKKPAHPRARAKPSHEPHRAGAGSRQPGAVNRRL